MKAKSKTMKKPKQAIVFHTNNVAHQCSFETKGPQVQITQELFLQIWMAMQEIDTEFMLYLVPNEQGVLSEAIVPLQTRQSCFCESKDPNPPPPNTTAFHAHPAGVNTFSSTDDMSISSNHIGSIVWPKNGLPVAVSKVKLPCGMSKLVESPITIMSIARPLTDEIKAKTVVEKLEILRTGLFEKENYPVRNTQNAEYRECPELLRGHLNEWEFEYDRTAPNFLWLQILDREITVQITDCPHFINKNQIKKFIKMNEERLPTTHGDYELTGLRCVSTLPHPYEKEWQ